MKQLNVFVLPGDGVICAPKKAVESFGSVVNRSFYLGSKKIPKGNREEFFAYIHEDEYLSKELTEALPVYLENDYWDCLVLMKRQKINGVWRIFQHPRIFKKHVELVGTLPINPVDLVFVRVLDGWVEKCST